MTNSFLNYIKAMILGDYFILFFIKNYVERKDVLLNVSKT